MTQVQPGDSLMLHFALRVHDSDQDIDSSFNDEPISMALGDGTLEPNLENCLLGLSVGDRRIFILQPALAFGEPEPAAIMQIPASKLTVAPAELDQLVEFRLDDNTTLAGLVIAIEADTVCVDFNHLLAGKTVEFEVEILSIAPRTAHILRNSA